MCPSQPLGGVPYPARSGWDAPALGEEQQDMSVSFPLLLYLTQTPPYTYGGGDQRQCVRALYNARFIRDGERLLTVATE